MDIVYFSVTSNEIPNLGSAVKRFTQSNGSLTLWAKSRSQLADNPAACDEFIRMAMAAHAVVITLMAGEQSCPAWDGFIQALKQAGADELPIPYLHVQPTGNNAASLEMVQTHSRGLKSNVWATLNQYYRFGGQDNLVNMLACLSNAAMETDWPVDVPKKLPNHGIYHPDLDQVPDPGVYFAGLPLNRPCVGIWFYQNFWATGNKAHIDALIREAEQQGANVIAVFHTRFKDKTLGQDGADHVADLYFKDGGNGGKSRIDVLVNPVMFSLKTASSDYEGLLEGLNVPVIQAVTTSRSIQEWEQSPQGLSNMDITIGVAQPELDGTLISVPVAAKEFDGIDPVTGSAINRYRPIPERIARLMELALNWAKLGLISSKDKKVAIVFHNYPPRADRIGCASGLDSFESVKRLMDRMALEGYSLDHSYESGDELARELVSGLTCDRRWILPEQMAKKTSATAGPDQYQDWHRALPDKVRTKMVKDWGQIPGDMFVHNDRMLFPGKINGNVCLMIQPPRGRIEDVDSDYHNPDRSPTHHYIGFYDWIRETFGAHAVIHVGKHGSLEWLPGKAVGLGPECFPGLAIKDIPNIYPYIINDPGEGTQAKRRCAACIIDHLPPAMIRAGLYDELADLERLASDYMETSPNDIARRERLKPLVWEAVIAAKMDLDMEISREKAMADFPGFMAQLHSILSEISHTAIFNGLHIMGQVPEGEDLIHTLDQMTRLANGNIPSLEKSVLKSLGLSLDARGKPLDYAVSVCHAMLKDLIEEPRLTSQDVMKTYLETPDMDTARVLDYITQDLMPRLNRSHEEITACVRALAGEFISPGPSGAPSRGRADLVPAGKNFYSVDPQKIPTPAAWETGKALAHALIKKYRDEHNTYPDTVGIILWASPTMRTKGDDVAQILYLLGVRPVWQKGSGNVRDVAVIPLSELGRPRIDVTPKISGMFRDAFPLLMDLIDRAVQMVAQLKEPMESNFIRGHVKSDAHSLYLNGMDRDDAFRSASFRIFGAAPGTYGTGVTQLVESKNWKTAQDLGETFIRHSSHAYGVNVFGKESTSLFRQVLGRVKVTVKNEDSREKDMMSCTDFYGYHGGLISAVEAVQGKVVMAVAGDSSDPDRVKVRTAKEEARHIFRSRLLNPKWINGLKKHGYKGAGDLSKAMDIIFGWDATSGVVDDYLYTGFARKTVLDPDTAQWLSSMNPHALENMIAKLLEANARGMWQASNEIVDELTQAYLDVEGQMEEISD